MADSVNQSERAEYSIAAGGSPTDYLQGSPSARGFFGKLPAELRNAIYEEAFRDSEMTLLSSPRGDPPPYPRGGRRSALFSSGHHHLLLTCRYIYDEARTMYWISTTVVNGEKHHRFSVDYLLSHLPPFAMQYIQNLRGLVIGYKFNWTESYYILPRPVQVLMAEEHRLRAQLPNLKAYQICEATHIYNPWHPRIPLRVAWQASTNAEICVNILKEIHGDCPPIFERSKDTPVALWRIRLLHTNGVQLYSGSRAGFIPHKVSTVPLTLLFENLSCGRFRLTSSPSFDSSPLSTVRLVKSGSATTKFQMPLDSLTFCKLHHQKRLVKEWGLISRYSEQVDRSLVSVNRWHSRANRMLGYSGANYR